MKVLIIGSGYVGTSLYNSITVHPDRYNAIETTLISKSGVNYHDPKILRTYLIKHEFDLVVGTFGFTGRPNVDEAEFKKEECWNLNVTVPTMVNRVCQKESIPYIHISSGCIFTGYEKDWSEEDIPNFGLFNEESSFYSKTKHAYETINDYGLTIRIRMPFCDNMHSRSFLYKIFKYDKIVEFVNSKTYIPDLCNFIKHVIATGRYRNNDVVNFVNSDPLGTYQVTNIMRDGGVVNPLWDVVDISELNLAANRSNCILAIDKLVNNYDYTPMTEIEALTNALPSVKL